MPPLGPGLEVHESAPAGDDVFRRPEPPPESPAQSGPSVVLLCDSCQWQAEDMIAGRLRMLGAGPERIITFSEVDCTDQCGGHRHPRPIRLPGSHATHRSSRLIFVVWI